MRQSNLITCEFCHKQVLKPLLNHHQDKFCKVIHSRRPPKEEKSIEEIFPPMKDWHAVGYTTKPLNLKTCASCGRTKPSPAFRKKETCVTCEDKERAFDGKAPLRFICN